MIPGRYSLGNGIILDAQNITLPLNVKTSVSWKGMCEPKVFSQVQGSEKYQITADTPSRPNLEEDNIK